MTQQNHHNFHKSNIIDIASFDWLNSAGFREKLNSEHYLQFNESLNIHNRETELLLLIRDQRDQSAFKELYKFYAPKLNSFVMKRGLSHSAASDVLQDVFVAIWRKASQFDAKRAPASAWIYRIARNKMIDHLRKEPMPIPEEFQILTDNDETDISKIYEYNTEVEALKTALKDLKPEQRTILESAYLGEMSHSEIQSMTGLPLGTIKSRIRIALEKLRHNMKAKDQ